MTCNDNSGLSCRTIQVIEPSSTLPAGSWRNDPSLDESGDTPLTQGQTEAAVTFVTPKVSGNYRFEFLYVDAFGVTNPGDSEPVVVTQTQFGFTVKFSGSPIGIGYIMRWRVLVVDSEIVPGLVDTPESKYLQLPQSSTMVILFDNPRSSNLYGFTELRVENLIDAAVAQTPILVQVVAKTLTGFTLALNPTPPNDNYFLAMRTP